MATELTAERVRELLHYDSETGIFTNAVNRAHLKAGAVAGCKLKIGYISISVLGRQVYGHRLAWLYVRGEWPTNTIDHINGDRADNRIENLRDVTHTVNLQNRKRAPSGSASGLLGAQWRGSRKKWMARIKVNGVNKTLGHFNTPEEAHAVYLVAKRKLHEGCTI